MQFSSLLGALALASCGVVAQNVTYCPSGNVCYAVNVPATTASSGSGDIYFQITGPSTLSWIGLGQGTSMTGANIFMIYANSAGDNVTLSPRLGSGNRQPESDTTTDVTLLGGSGISNGVMTANVRCSNCNTWTGGSMSLTDTNSNWIWAYKTGSVISSDDVSANLAQHSNYGETTFNLQNAGGGSSSNPFLATTAMSTSSGNNSGSSSSGSSSVGGDSMPADYANVRMAHAILAPIAFVLFFPIGAMAIRLLSFPGLVWVHAGWMTFTYIIVLSSMGMGVWMAVVSKQLDQYHSIIGLVVVGCLLLQPISGFTHHLLYKREGRPNAATYPHIFWGRAVITLGIINGGLGLQLSGNTVKGEIAYGVVAAVMWLLWMIVIVLAFIRSRNKPEGETGEAVFEKPNDSTERMRISQSVHQQDSPLRLSFSGDNIGLAPKPTYG
ncbi:CBD9-like protein [Mollisia scopiformis]|uniref:CBD9-like protein n=1 Tax=Mollisia scopiformis TaxID=149040 RepID=A0A194XI55_MOLSC|nr:CBD9-like protein [Mollisia scopiformis]KUJ19843.1 CBD9-like protein [Mollisia scopiformis]